LTDPRLSQSSADPLEHTLLHRLLVNSNRLQALPPAAIIVTLLMNSALVAAGWISGTGGMSGGLLVALAFLLACAAQWALLRTLRTSGRSYGPEKPSVLALAAVQALLLVTLGLVAAPVWMVPLLLATITALVYYSTWIEPFRLGVTHQTYRTPKLKPDGPPIRLLQIGDMHIERITPRERDLNRRVAALQPDIIVYTGDFVNLSNTHDPESERAIREIIREWRAPLGVYCVSGTPLVEPLHRVEAFTDGLDNLKLLRNQWITVETPGGPLHILGLIVSHDMARDRALLRKMMLSAPKSGLRLLNFHPPDIAPEANEAGIDLYLCGHTHGGQIRLPLVGALFSSSHLGNQYIMGRYELGTTTLYTARGVGLEGLGAPRARFLCPPEIVLWEIWGEQAAN
jgi:predicted MPP superfamily phosphohydrolase